MTLSNGIAFHRPIGPEGSGSSPGAAYPPRVELFQAPRSAWMRSV
jgi:hypothetical protein